MRIWFLKMKLSERAAVWAGKIVLYEVTDNAEFLIGLRNPGFGKFAALTGEYLRFD